MTIYLEHAIIDNMVINGLLLYLVFKTMKQRVPRWKVFLSALVGTGFALVLPLLSWSGVAAIVIRIFVGLLMVFIVQHKSVRRYILFFLLFIAYTFAFGGAVFGILFMTNNTHGSLLYFSSNTAVPMGFLVGGVFIFFLLMKLLVKFLNARHSASQHLRDIIIHYKGERYKVASYLDTGNRLTDPQTKAPVVIISLSLFLRIFPDISADRIVLNKLDKEVEDGRYIPFSTVGKDGKMFTFSPTALEILEGNKNKIKRHENIRLGVSMKGFKDAVQYDALLNANLI